MRTRGWHAEGPCVDPVDGIGSQCSRRALHAGSRKGLVAKTAGLHKAKKAFHYTGSLFKEHRLQQLLQATKVLKSTTS